MNTNSNQNAEREAEPYAIFDVEALYQVVRGRAWLIAACAIGGLLLAAVYVATSPDVFEATATVHVEEEDPTVAPIQDVTKEDFRQPEDLKTVEVELQARTLLWRVIEKNKLDKDPEFFKPGILHRILGHPVTKDDMIIALTKKFKVKQNRGTRLIDITAKHTNPKMAQTLARSLIDEYVNQNIEWRARPSKEANKFLIEEAERLKKVAEVAEQALQDYREQNHAVSLEDKQNIVVDRLKDLNLRVAKAQNDTSSLESDLALVEKLGRQPDKLIAIGSIANSMSVLDAQRVASGKEAAFALLRQRYGPENPAYAQAERELRQVRATLDAAVLNAADSLRSAYEAAKFTQQASEKTLKEQEELALDLNRKATHYAALGREVEADHALFHSLLKRLNEMGVMEHVNQVNLRVVDPPMLPDSTSLFYKALIVALGTFGGGFMGFCGILGLFVARPSIQSPDHAGRALGIPALGTIPRMPRIRDASALPGIAAPRSQAAEAFRFLVTSASSILGADGKGSLLLTSAAPGDGSTPCAAGYAVAVARSGVRTLLVDADLRSPAIGRLFSVPKDASGLADCLAGRSTLEASVRPTKVDNLFVLAAGTAPAEISSLFSGPAFGELIG
ncbi:MAG: exopolysaccharide transport family protein, partial [Chthoniobacteraceae bacterium]